MSAQKPKTILLVEDEVLIALAEKQTIEAFGYKVLIANSGEKAVEIATGDEKPDIILMDIDLGMGINGPEAAAAILSKNTIPIVFLTSHSERETVEKVRDITRYGYVIKNSGDFVLQSSIEMAFELFDAFQRLTDSEGKYGAAFRTSPDAVNINSMDGRYVDINEGFTKLTGYTRAEVIGVLSSEIKIWAIPEDRDRLVKGLKERGAVDDLESSFRCKDDSLKTCLMSARVIRFNGQSHILSITRDISERKRMEDALRISEAHFRALFEKAMDGIIYISPDTELVEVNESFAGMHGYTVEEMQKMKLQDLDVADFSRLVPERMKRLQNGEQLRFDVQHYHKDGRIIDLEVSTTMIASNDKRHIVAFHRDITDRKRIEQALKEEATRRRILFEESPVGIVIIDPPTARFLEFNTAAHRQLGYSREEFARLSIVDIEAKEAADETRRHIEDVIRDGKADFETLQRARDGETRVVHVTAQIVDVRGNPVYYCIWRDITERRRAEEALRESELKFRGFVQYSGDPIFSFNPDETYRFVNEAFAKPFGRKPQEIVGKQPHAIFSHEEAEKRLAIVRQVFQTGEKREIDVKVIARSGEIKYYLTTAEPAKDEQGRVLYVSCISKDITERKQAEEKIRTLLAEKELLLKEVHHRIKNNMNTMMSLIGLQAKSVNDPGSIAALNGARGRMESMMVLYDKLYRSEEFRELSAREYLVPLVHEIAANFENREKVTIETRVDDVILDAKRLSPLGIVINELITNMMRHAFVGRDKGVISITVSQKENRVTVVVEDNGIGLPEAFDLHTSAGFGLRLVNALTQQIGGTMKIERENGTRFILEFEV